MQAFLPSGYSFSPDKLINQSKYQSLIRLLHESQQNEPKIHILFSIVIVILVIRLILKIVVSIKKDEKVVIFKKTVNFHLITSCGLLVSMFCGMWGIFIGLQGTPTRWFNHLDNYYKTAYFQYPVKSNLNVCMLDENNRPRNTNDHKKYPYEIYLRHPKKYQFDVDGSTLVVSGHYEFKTNKPVHIGKMRDNKFIPANNHLAGIFNKYYTYIIKHDLSDKFADTMMFKPNSNYLTINGDVQWVLSNDKDLVLYLHNGSTVKESKIAKD